MLLLRTIFGVLAMAGLAVLFSAPARADGEVGVLSCDVSRGIGLFVFEKQKLSCRFKPNNGAPPDLYTGSIDEFGLALGEIAQGHLAWAVVAAGKGPEPGALAGSYAGVGANASFGVGAGANILVGGTGRSFSLQPISVEGETGVNIAGGVTTLTLAPAP